MEPHLLGVLRGAHARSLVVQGRLHGGHRSGQCIALFEAVSGCLVEVGAAVAALDVVVRRRYEIFHVPLVQLRLLKVEDLGLWVAVASVEDGLGHDSLHVDQVGLLLRETC